MPIEFDPDKDAINRAKHGVSLAFGERVFDDPAVVIVHSVRAGDGEARRKAVGMVNGSSGRRCTLNEGGSSGLFR